MNTIPDENNQAAHNGEHNYNNRPKSTDGSVECKKKLLLAQGKSDSFLNRWAKMITEYEHKHVTGSANDRAADNKRESRPSAKKLSDWWKYDGIRYALEKQNGTEIHDIKQSNGYDNNSAPDIENYIIPALLSKKPRDQLQDRWSSAKKSKTSSSTRMTPSTAPFPPW